jgi:hypothetical protein
MTCVENHELRVEAGVQALLQAADNDLKELISSLMLREARGIDGILNESLRHLLVHLTHLINHCIRLSHFPKPWKEGL